MTVGWQILDAATTTRKNLLRAGYRPIPATGKKPPIPGWTDIVATEPVIDKWFHQYDNAFNTGILTRTTPAVDIDIYDPDVAEEIEALLWDMIGERGMVRFGQPPKRAALFRTDTPFKKIETPFFVAPSGTENHVEILCDGQQIVVFGTHPDTGKDYSWHGGQPGDIARADLPELTEALAREFITKAIAILRAQEGWVEKTRKPNGGNSGAHHNPAGVGDEFDAIYGDRERKYALAALQGCAAELAGMAPVPCGRNSKLNALAFRLGTMSARGWINRDEVIDRLFEAAVACRLVADDGEAVARATIRSGLDSGELEPHPDLGGVSVEDFYGYMPAHSYIFAPSREMWPASSVNARITPIQIDTEDGKERTIPASAWIDRNKPVEQMTWAPGLPMLIRNRLIAEGGWIEREGMSCFNLYRPPVVKPGDAAEAGPWIDHVHKVFGDDANHIIPWLAQRVQHPHEKINHGLVFGGAEGIGKDTLLEPVKYAIGPWNFSEASPQQMLGRFNSFIKSVILRVSEGRDLGDVDRFKFHDHMKTILAAPPDVLRVDEKHLKEHHVPNVTGVIITTNHKTDGIYLPADDRRHFVAWSDLTKEDFTAAYWNSLWGWYGAGGIAHIAAYLATLDLKAFDPKAPPPKTPAFWDVVDANQAPEDAELADVLDRMGNPDATTLIRIIAAAMGEIELWLRERKNRRQIPYRLEKCGYVPIRNDASSQGLWVINGTRQAVYAKNTLSIRDRLKAARQLVS
jgi:hypothetical protein